MKYLINIKFFILLFICLLNAEAGVNTNVPQVRTGVYSNMYYNEDAGDLLGIEIFLVKSTNGYMVVFQGAEGGPASVPIVVSAQVIKNKITFVLPENSIFPGTFTGYIQNSRIVGGFDKNYLNPSAPGTVFILPRKKSYWQ